MTVNCTAWSSLTSFLQAGASGASLVLVQEHHLRADELDREAAWARSVGWSAGLGAALPTVRGGTCGGVGALTPSFRGLGSAPGWQDLDEVQGRVSCFLWNGGGVPGGLVVASVYLECGVGMNETNWAIIHHLAVELQTMGRPFLIGGDFQMTPAELEAEGVLNVLRGVEVICSTGAGTCHSKGSWSNIDFFLISRELVPRVVGCEVVLDASFRPHRPLAVRLRRGGALPLERVLAAPRAFPMERPVGPVQDLQLQWSRVDDVDDKQDLDMAVAGWFSQAETFVANCCMLENARPFCGRGRTARFKWVRPQVKKMLGRARVSSAARAWYWLADRLGELAVLVDRPPIGCWAHRCGIMNKVCAWMPPTGQLDLRMLWLERLRGAQGASGELLRQWQGLATALAEAEAASWTSRRRKELRAWVAQACAGAGKGAHRVTKQPVGWRPDPREGDGPPLDRQGRVEALARQWRSDVWAPKADALTELDFDGLQYQELPRPSVVEVRAAAQTFPATTGLGVDMWHPRLFAWLPDDGLQGWIDLMMIAERKGWLPAAMETLTVVFIPKGSGGVRPIGLFTASQRLWGKVRRQIAAQWEREHQRAFFWGGAGKSVEQCVWEQCLDGEYALATGRKAASVLIDLTKAYEMLSHRMCLGRFIDAAVPMRYARWCLLCYGGPRVLRLDGVFSDVFQVGASIVAGCAGATTLLRAVLLQTCDLASQAGLEMATRFSLKVVVDDITVQGLSASQEAPDAYEDFEAEMGKIVGMVAGGLEGQIGATVSDDKTVVIGTSEAVVERVVGCTGHRWRGVAEVRNLGVDTSYTRPAATTQQSRQLAAASRVGRFAFLRRHGGKVAGVARGGPRAAMVFGAAVQGATDAMVRRIRSTTGACAFGALGGASLTLKFMLSEARCLDPVFDLTLQPLRAWAVGIWEGAVDQRRRMAVAFQAAVDFMTAGGCLDRRAPGPTTALLTSLSRIGWRAENFKVWVTDRGQVLCLDKVCPRSMMILGQLAVERWQWRHLAGRYPEEFPGFDHGGDLKPLKQVLGRKSPLTTGQQVLVRCAASRRLWPEWRRAVEGYQSCGNCGACQDEEGTLRHALYRCPALALVRHHRDLGDLAAAGGAEVAEHHLYSRGVLPDIRHQAPNPLHRETVVWDSRSKTGLLEGHVFLDGSRLHGDDPLLARAGWGVAMVRVVGEVVARAWGPYPGVIQCIDAAEVYAGIMALRLGAPPIVLYSDSAFFVGGWQRGQAWCTAGGRAHADVWRQFWQMAADFGIGAIQVVKVKGHATQAMVDGGLVNDVDRWGNEQADDAAKKGAALHPDVGPIIVKQNVQRAAARQAALWIGVGLEAAQCAGALPHALSQAGKAERARRGVPKQLEVQKDDAWREAASRAHVGSGAHESHALLEVAPFLFCTRCGCYASQRLLALGDPCQQAATPSRRFLLKRLLEGRHPRSGEMLGEVKPWDPTSSSLTFTASRRGSRASTA